MKSAVIGSLLSLTIALAGCASTGLTTTSKEISVDPQAYADKNFTLSQIPIDVAQKITAADNGPLLWKTISVHIVKHKILVTQGTEFDINSDVQFTNLGGPFVLQTSTNSINAFVNDYSFNVSYRGLVNVVGQNDTISNQYSNWPSRLKAVSRMESLPTALAAHRPIELTVEEVVETNKPTSPWTSSKRCEEKGAPYSASAINPDITGQAIDLACAWRNDANIETKTDIETYLFDFGLTITKQLADRTSSFTFKVTSWQVN